MEESPKHRNTNSSLDSDLERSFSKEPYRFFNVFKDVSEFFKGLTMNPSSNLPIPNDNY